jgi:hypothetical protein
LTGTPVAGLIVVYPGVEIKPVEGNSLFSDANFHQMRADFRVETVFIHAEIERHIP